MAGLSVVLMVHLMADLLAPMMVVRMADPKALQ
jgi:hypothetical protein